MKKNEFKAEIQIGRHWLGVIALVERIATRRNKEILSYFETSFSELREFLNTKHADRPLIDVVRCDECTHGEPTTDMHGLDAIRCGRYGLCVFGTDIKPLSWYCADGEKKDR